MSVLLKKFIYFPVDNLTAAQNITDSFDTKAGRGLDIKNNVLEMTFKNSPQSFDVNGNLVYRWVNADGTLKFQENDQIKIYLKYTDDMADVESAEWGTDPTVTPENDFLEGVFFIMDTTVAHSISQNSVKVKCADKSFLLFNKMLARAFVFETTNGTTTSTASGKLVDSSAKFLNSNVANVGMRIENTTDSTVTRITNIDSDTQLSVAEDIFTSGENYSLRWTAPSIIQKVIRETTQGSSTARFKGTGGDAGAFYDIDARMESEGVDADGVAGFIQDERRDENESGLANTDLTFPETTLSKVWKPVYEWIGELSELEDLNTTAELEGNLVYGLPFFFYIDEDNRFHWTQRTSKEVNAAFNITIGTTKNVFSHKLGESVFEVVNFIVYRGGEDLFGNGTLDYQVDESTGTKLSKMRVVAMTDIAKNLIETEIVDANLVLVSDGAFTFSGNRYDRGTTTVTPAWTNVSVSTDDNYNDSLITEIKKRADQRARKLMSGLSSPRFKGPIELKGHHIPAGTLFEFTDLAAGIINEKVRVNDIRQTISAVGWFTQYNVEQDAEAIIQTGT